MFFVNQRFCIYIGLTLEANDRYVDRSRKRTKNRTGGRNSGDEGRLTAASMNSVEHNMMDHWKWEIMTDVEIGKAQITLMSSESIPVLFDFGMAVKKVLINCFIRNPAAREDHESLPQAINDANNTTSITADYSYANPSTSGNGNDTRLRFPSVQSVDSASICSWVKEMAFGNIRVHGPGFKLKLHDSEGGRPRAGAILVAVAKFNALLWVGASDTPQASEPLVNTDGNQADEKIRLARRLIFDVGQHSSSKNTVLLDEELNQESKLIGMGIYNVEQLYAPIFQIPEFVLEMKTVETINPIIKTQFDIVWDDNITVAPDLSYRFLQQIIEQYYGGISALGASTPDDKKAGDQRQSMVGVVDPYTTSNGLHYNSVSSLDTQRVRASGVGGQSVNFSRIHNWEHHLGDKESDDDDEDEDGTFLSSKAVLDRSRVPKRIDAKGRFDLGDPQLNVLNKVGGGMSLGRLLGLLGLVDEKSPLDVVLPEAVQRHLIANLENVLKNMHNMSLKADTSFDT